MRDFPGYIGDETAPESGEPAAADEISAVEGKKERRSYDRVPLYFQNDYPDTMYGFGTIATSGCSITALAMVATYMTGYEYTPVELAKAFGGKGSNNIKRLEFGSKALQLPHKRAANFHYALQGLKEGKVVIALMGKKSIFTDSQHFIVLTGLNEEGKIMVHDPYEPNYERWELKNAFINGFDEGDISCGYEGAWIYDKAAVPEEPFLFEDEPYGDPRHPGITLSDEDRELLAKMIWVEANGESYIGQQAVAEVVINRLASDDFPDTVSGVIFADNQFRSTERLDEAEPYQTQYDAIERALRGPYVLPENVMFFATYAVNNRIWGVIGGHVFCYGG